MNSTDLVNWEQISNVIDRPDQINFGGFRESLFSKFIVKIEQICLALIFVQCRNNQADSAEQSTPTPKE